MQKLILTTEDDSILPILENFLDRPRKLKFDLYDGKLYHIIWSESALKLRKQRISFFKRELYKNTEMTPYIKQKLGISNTNPKRGRPSKIIFENDAPL